MRSIVLCCAIIAQVVGVCHAQSLDQVIPANQRIHDFGAVARASNTEHRFTLTNPYQSNLHIRSIRASCGCTTPIVETETIPPGQTGTILARFNTGTFFGQKGATLTVSIDKPFFTELQLNVKGYIRTDVVLTPGEAAFGNVPEGEAQSLEFSLNYAGRSDWAITEITSPLDCLKPTFEETERQNGRVAYKINLDLQSNAPAGLLQSQLIVHTNDRRLTTLPIRVLANVEPPLQVSPQTLALGNIKAGETIQQKMVLKGKEPFRILEIKSLDAEIRFDNDDKARKAHLINIFVAPVVRDRTGTVNGEVLVKTDMLDTPMKMQMSYTIQTESPLPPAEVQAAN
jgi:hypothetical protein